MGPRTEDFHHRVAEDTEEHKIEEIGPPDWILFSVCSESLWCVLFGLLRDETWPPCQAGKVESLTYERRDGPMVSQISRNVIEARWNFAVVPQPPNRSTTRHLWSAGRRWTRAWRRQPSAQGIRCRSHRAGRAGWGTSPKTATYCHLLPNCSRRTATTVSMRFISCPSRACRPASPSHALRATSSPLGEVDSGLGRQTRPHP